MRVTQMALLFSGFLLLTVLVAFIQVKIRRSKSSVSVDVGIDPTRRSHPSDQVISTKPAVPALPTRRPRRNRKRKIQRQDIPETFVVLDLETTGRSPSVDEIIEFGALRVCRATSEVIAFRSIVKPERRVPPLISEMTGITQHLLDTEGVPLTEAFFDFMEFIGELPLVIYNAKFDMAFLGAAASEHGRTITNSYTCALTLAKRAWPDLSSYSLVDVCRSTCNEAEIVASPEMHAHRALGDCKRTVDVFLSAASILEGDITWTSPEVDPSSTESSRRPTKGARRGTTPMYEHSVSKHGEPGCPLCGEVVVFTGALSIPRGQASSLAAAAGCEVRVGVTHHTTMLVVGIQDMSLLAGKEKSCKHLAAEALIREGQPIRILNETEFMRLIVDAKVGVPY